MATDELKYWDVQSIPVKEKSAPLEIEPVTNNRDLLEELLRERRSHREKLLRFIMNLTVASFTLLSSIVAIQVITRLYLQKPFSIFDGYELEFLISGVFGQIIGLIAIIVKSLWDDKNYLNSLMR